MNGEKQFTVGEGDNQALLVFNLNVMAKIQAEFGSVNKWASLLEDDKENPVRGGEPDMDAFLKGFGFMLNEGVDIENEGKPADQQKAPYTQSQVGRMIGKWGQNAVAEAMKQAVTGSTETGDKAKKE